MKYSRAILHFDGDSFFASIEQAMNHTLRGKPVVTGAERGAATALSIEAKRLGLYRGMSMREIRQRCPDVIVVDSDYTAYSIYARRMYAIVRRYAPRVEEYSIDECFADITGLERVYRLSYEEIGRMIKRDLERSLGITFGVGLAPNKVLAKVGSKHNKPGGFTPIPRGDIAQFLEKLPVGSIWGIGFSMALKLQNLGVETALQFARKDEAWLREHRIAKPYREIWYELNGDYARQLALEGNGVPSSIIKTRTFAPPSRDRAFVLSQLSKNLERACEKARKSGVRSAEVGLMLKTQDFLYRTGEVRLSVPTADAGLIFGELERLFERLFVPNILYRATGVSLRALVRQESTTLDLFGETRRVDERAPVLEALDALNRRYGRATVHLASSLSAHAHREPQRSKTKRAAQVRFSSEQYKKTIDLPFLGKAK